MIFRSLQEDHPNLFGEPSEVDTLFYRPSVEKVAQAVFVNQSTVRSKKKTLRHKNFRVDEICILDNIARYVT